MAGCADFNSLVLATVSQIIVLLYHPSKRSFLLSLKWRFWVSVWRAPFELACMFHEVRLHVPDTMDQVCFRESPIDRTCKLDLLFIRGTGYIWPEMTPFPELSQNALDRVASYYLQFFFVSGTERVWSKVDLDKMFPPEVGIGENYATKIAVRLRSWLGWLGCPNASRITS